jgi:hypothetical protein
MNKSLIDMSLFLNGIEPWPNQVFNKTFDAYFLLTYPPFYLNTNDENIFDPFDLLNNLDEKNIYVSDAEGKSKLMFALDSNWNRQLYYDAYKSKISEKRFLFWESDNDKWAMVSDAKYQVAIIGIDWKLANQIPLFFQQNLLSPIQFLEKVRMQKHEAIFFKNYKPASILTEGNIHNPVWIKYYFQCHVENENDKLFYWQQFEKIFHTIQPALKHCKSIDMYADQALSRRYWRNKQWYSSSKIAPVGGWQKYTYANCNKVANKFLNDNEHLCLAFAGRHNESEDLYIANKKGLIEFFTFWIYASLNKVAFKGGQSDFYFQTTLHSFSNKETLYNQNFEFCYKKNLISESEINRIVDELSTIGMALKIHRLEMPYTFAHYTNNEPLQITSMYSALPDLKTNKDLHQQTRIKHE